jgi:hypothetical protein
MTAAKIPAPLAAMSIAPTIASEFFSIEIRPSLDQIMHNDLISFQNYRFATFSAASKDGHLSKIP